MNKYADRYLIEDKDFLSYSLSTINNYINYTERNGVEITAIKDEFELLKKKVNLHDFTIHAGIYKESRKHVTSEAQKDFKSLLFSRHSLRYFYKDVPSDSLLKEALVLAQQTPSACNRQGWKTHIFTDSKCLELLKWQGGCRGLEEEIPCAILVTANMKAFLSYEVHQAYVEVGFMP